MARYSDEAWEMISDSIDKKITGRSARSTRTHCGKRGAVKFPSDYKSRKELNAMNGEVKSYRMNEAMTWDEFVKMPIDLQRKYISHLREKFNAPDAYIAEMFGKTNGFFIDHLFRLKISTYTPKEGETWDREGFMAWRLGVDVGETEPAPVVENKEEETVDILDRPMDFKQFKALTEEQQKEYIERLRKKFDVPNSYLAKMMGVTQSCISSNCNKLNVGYGRPTGSRRAWNEAGWNAWLNGVETTATNAPETVVLMGPIEVVEPVVEEPEIINETPHLTKREKEKIDNFVQDLRELSAEVIEGINSKKYPTDEEIAMANAPIILTKEQLGDFKKCRDEQPASIEIPHECPVPIMPMSGTMTFQGYVDDILTTLKTLLSGTRNKLTVTWEPME